MGHNPAVVPVGQGPPSTREGLDHTSTLSEDIYRRRPPEFMPILILAQPAEIPDEPPGGEEIAVAVRGLCTGRAGGPSGVRAENLQGWLRGATQEMTLTHGGERNW